MEEKIVDPSTPRTSEECITDNTVEDYKDDICKFCFTEFYIIEHTRQVILEMKNFIKGRKYIQPRLRNG